MPWTHLEGSEMTEPTAPARSAHRLEMTLPDEWRVINLRSVAKALRAGEQSAVGVARDEIELLLEAEASDPDLVAVLSLPLEDDDGEVLARLLGSLVVVLVAADGVPPAEDSAFASRVIPEVPLASGDKIAFLVLTVPVFSDDGQDVALLTFSSPSVALAGVLEQGFRRIAATARVVRSDGDRGAWTLPAEGAAAPAKAEAPAPEETTGLLGT